MATDRDDINLEALRKTLQGRREELERASKVSAESREAVELDQTRQGRLSRQDAMMQQEMAKETERRRQADIQRIDAALRRMESDPDYGFCIRCGEKIASKRLEVDPAITTCIACAVTLGK